MSLNLQKFNIPRYLSTMPMFADLAQDEIERLAAGARVRRLERGATVFQSGDACHYLHLLVLGQVKLFVLASNGVEKVIELCSNGQCFGETFLVLNTPCTVSAQSLSEGLLLSIDRDTVLAEIERDGRFALSMMNSMSRRLHRLMRDVESYSLQSGVERVIDYLIRGEDGVSRDVPPTATVSLPASKAAIASRLSLTPEYFSRVLHDLSSAGLIEVDRREIQIPDTARLASYAPPSRQRAPALADR